MSQIMWDTGLTAADAWALADDRSTWRALRPTAGYAQQWVSEYKLINHRAVKPGYSCIIDFFKIRSDGGHARVHEPGSIDIFSFLLQDRPKINYFIFSISSLNIDQFSQFFFISRLWKKFASAVACTLTMSLHYLVKHKYPKIRLKQYSVLQMGRKSAGKFLQYLTEMLNMS